MKSGTLRLTVGIALASVLPAFAFSAEEASKTLPTLLIKGEVVSVDTTDPSAVLLKVKDRYGFETPIYLGQEAKISQGDTTLNASNLAAGTGVEVEYNFDINTAKRHAVSVKLATPTASAAAPSSTATPAVPAPTPEPATPEAPASSSPNTPAESAPSVQ